MAESSNNNFAVGIGMLTLISVTKHNILILILCNKSDIFFRSRSPCSADKGGGAGAP